MVIYPSTVCIAWVTLSITYTVANVYNQNITLSQPNMKQLQLQTLLQKIKQKKNK